MKEEKIKWFKEAKFGMFIHWGLYSILGRGEWVRYHESIPAKEYEKLADQFNPKNYRPREWAKLAKKAGMKYMVLTTKHHDGFCLFDSKYTDFTTSKSIARRDFVKDYVEACRAEGLGVGLYFTVKDWSFPVYFKGPKYDPEGWENMVRYFHNQTLELMSNYGKIDLFFFDGDDDPNFRGGWGDRTKEIFKAEKLFKEIRKLQPDILINNRCGGDGDYGTPEQHIPNMNGKNNQPTEVCMTMNNSWGYSIADDNWKSTKELIQTLVSCAARGHNLLLNVGPDSEGVIPKESVERLNEIGMWMKAHGDGIYGSERYLPDWWDYTSNGRITTKNNKAYLMIPDWRSNGSFVFSSIKNKIISARLLANNQKLVIKEEGRRKIIKGLPIHEPFPWMNVIELELEEKAEAQFYY